MKIQIMNRYSGKVIFEHECEDNTVTKTVLKAIACDTDLSDANLRNADLRNANLSYANLSYADLRNANLSYANLRNADLRNANLRNADLSSIMYDFFGRLSVVPNEAKALLDAIKKGKIKGSSYEGDCCCFVGTVANNMGVFYQNVPGLKPDQRSQTERWFLGIKEGDTPQTSQISAITAGWVESFIANQGGVS